MHNNYFITGEGKLVSVTEDELYHYGVKGMKWGVRRASKRLSKSTTAEERKKAITSLEKHRSKASSKVASLEKKLPKLEAKVERRAYKSDVKAANMHARAARIRQKAYGPLVSRKRSAKRVFKADKLEARASALSTKTEALKAKVHANKTMREAFNRGIKDIDQILVKNGKKYVGAA